MIRSQSETERELRNVTIGETEETALPRYLSIAFIALLSLGCATDKVSFFPWWLAQLSQICIIGMSAIWLLVTGDFSRAKDSFRILCVFLIPYVFILCHSILLWIVGAADNREIRTGIVETSYMMLNVISYSVASMLFGRKLLRYTMTGLILGCAPVALDLLKRYGVSTFLYGLTQIWVDEFNPITRGFEIHYLMFAYAFLMVFIVFEWKRFSTHKGFIIALVGVSYLGWKRTGILVIVLSFLYIWRTSKMSGERLRKFNRGCIIFLFLFSLLYLFVCATGKIADIYDTLGIDSQGRTELDTQVLVYGEDYVLSPFYCGKGVMAVHEIMKEAIANNKQVLTTQTNLHNDILGNYFELGALGFVIWFFLMFLLPEIAFSRWYSQRVCRLWIIEVIAIIANMMFSNTMRALPLLGSMYVSTLAIVFYEKEAAEKPDAALYY